MFIKKSNCWAECSSVVEGLSMCEAGGSISTVIPQEREEKTQNTAGDS